MSEGGCEGSDSAPQTEEGRLKVIFWLGPELNCTKIEVLFPIAL